LGSGLSHLTPSVKSLIFTGEFSPKREIKNWKIENEVILEGFNCQKWEEKNNKNRQIWVLGFQCVAINTEGWLKIFLFHISFIARFG
jgi:hypothetical protein